MVLEVSLDICRKVLNMLKVIAKHIVGSGESARLDDYANGLFPQVASRKGAKKAVKKGLIRLNGAEVEGGRYVQAGDEVTLVEGAGKPFRVYPLTLVVVHEDEYLAVIYKPAGIPVSGNAFRTLAHALPQNLKPGTTADALTVPLPVHRLDAATSGLLLVAKAAGAMVALGQLFENRAVEKVYAAVVVGTPADSGWIQEPIEGQEASTRFKVLNSVPSHRFGSLSLVELRPETGRTHQLRIHMAGIGHPILGDRLYGEPGKILLKKGLYLSAVGLKFMHPVSGDEVGFDVEVPGKMKFNPKNSHEFFVRRTDDL